MLLLSYWSSSDLVDLLDILLMFLSFVISSKVTLVGLIKNVKESATRIDYELDDMTGPPIEVRHFNESDVSSNLHQTLQNDHV